MTRPEIFCERATGKKIRDKIIASPCSWCIHRTGWDPHFTCKVERQSYPKCLDAPVVTFTLDVEKHRTGEDHAPT